MTVPVCAWCGVYIDSANRDSPGFCSPVCAESDRLDRDRTARDLAQRRADARLRRATARTP